MRPIRKYKGGGEVPRVRPIVEKQDRIKPPPTPIIKQEDLPFSELMEHKDAWNPTEEEMKNMPYWIDPWTGKQKANGAITPVADLRDAADFVPGVSHALTFNDAKTAAKSGNWGAAALAVASLAMPVGGRTSSKILRNSASRNTAHTMSTLANTMPEYAKKKLPYLPKHSKVVDKNAIDKAIESTRKLAEERKANRMLIKSELNELGYRAFEDLSTPYAMKRAEKIDAKYGTNYKGAYEEIASKYNSSTWKDWVDSLPESDFIDNPSLMPYGVYAKTAPGIVGDKKIRIDYNMNQIKKPSDISPGLVNHEIGHNIDNIATYGNMHDNPFMTDLGDTRKFWSYDEMLDRLPQSGRLKESGWEYLTTPTEIKSHMNQLRKQMEYDGILKHGADLKMKPKQLQKYLLDLENKSVVNRPNRLLFDLYKEPEKFIEDFNNIPIVNVRKPNNNKESLV